MDRLIDGALGLFALIIIFGMMCLEVYLIYLLIRGVYRFAIESFHKMVSNLLEIYEKTKESVVEKIVGRGQILIPLVHQICFSLSFAVYTLVPLYYLYDFISGKENPILTLIGLVVIIPASIFFAGPLVVILCMLYLALFIFSVYLSSYGIHSILHYTKNGVDGANKILLNNWRPFSIQELSDDSIISLYYPNERGEMMEYGVLPAGGKRTKGCKLFLQDDGNRFSIGEFQQSLADGFFYRGANRNDKLYIKRIT